MSDNGASHFDMGFDPNNGVDSDNSQNGDRFIMNSGEVKVCRDFMRNVCNRKKGTCKFIHPENIKIRTEPIFCHDYQQNKCFRSTCKFIHCTREDEDHYKQTGELPEGCSGAEYYEARPVRGKPGMTIGRKPTRLNSQQPSGSRGGGRNGFNSRRNGGDIDGQDNNEIPICKDNLKGVCDRPRGGCKFRHVNPSEVSSYGGLAGSVGQGQRRRGNQNYYDTGPDAKRNHYSTDYGTDYIDYSIPQTYSPPPPPPPPQSTYPTSAYTTYHDPAGSLHGLTHQNQNSSSAAASMFNAGANQNRNGYVAQSQLNDMSTAMTSFMTPNSHANSNTAAAMKALEDENFMLKRRIEELKKQVSDLVATNEYLLSQNAHFRINNMKEGVAAAGTGVVQTLVSMAQPIGINPSLSVAPTQPLSTITSMSIPTVSMTPVSISQPGLPIVSMSQHPSQPSQAMLSQPQVYPLVTTQGVLPPN